MTSPATASVASLSGKFSIGGDLPVTRMGYGAMRITGPGIWGDPADVPGAHAVLRRAVELGVTFFDTADSYGPETSERLIGEALAPYADDVVIATKCGLTRQGPGQWLPVGRPEYLRQQTELSLRRLKLDAIPLQQLHRIDPQVPVADSLGALFDLVAAGKIRHVGVSEVTPEQLVDCQACGPIAAVQNRYNLADREWDAMVDLCSDQNIAFIPWFPLAAGDTGKLAAAIGSAAAAHDATANQVALAWLLHRSPAMLPIPGTSTIAHLEENVAAAALPLTPEELAALDAAI